MVIFLRSLVRLAESVKRSISQHFTASKWVAIASLVGVFLIGTGAPAQAADIDYSKTSQGGIQSTERYDNIRSKSGGMNNFDAADPRRNIDEASAKAQELSDVAKRRQMEASDPFEPVREVAEDVKNKVTNTVQEADPLEPVKEAADDVKNKVGDVKNRVGNAVQGADVDYSKNSQGGIQSTQRYGRIQSESGGMNDFNAADPRRGVTEAGARAQRLSETAGRRNLEAADPLEPVREAVDEVKSKIAGTADSLK